MGDEAQQLTHAISESGWAAITAVLLLANAAQFAVICIMAKSLLKALSENSVALNNLSNVTREQQSIAHRMLEQMGKCHIIRQGDSRDPQTS